MSIEEAPDLDDEDDAILDAIWDRIGKGLPPLAPGEFTADHARALLISAVGRDKADVVKKLPTTREAFDRLMIELNGSVNYDALRRMMRHLGVK